MNVTFEQAKNVCEGKLEHDYRSWYILWICSDLGVSTDLYKKCERRKEGTRSSHLRMEVL